MINWALNQYDSPNGLTYQERLTLLANDLSQAIGREVNRDELKSERLASDVYLALLRDRAAYIYGLTGVEQNKEIALLDADVTAANIGSQPVIY